MDFGFDSSWIDHLAIQAELEKLFQRKIDVVSKFGLHPYIKDRILREAIEV